MDILVKNRNLGKTPKFAQKMDIFGEKSKFDQKIDIFANIEIFDSNRNVGKKLLVKKFLVKICDQILPSFLGRNRKFYPKNQNFI